MTIKLVLWIWEGYGNPKGIANKDLAMEFINEMMKPEVYGRICKIYYLWSNK